MHHVPLELWVGSLASESRAAVILWGASHFTVNWLCTIILLALCTSFCHPDKKRYKEGEIIKPSQAMNV